MFREKRLIGFRTPGKHKKILSENRGQTRCHGVCTYDFLYNQSFRMITMNTTKENAYLIVYTSICIVIIF